MAGADRSPSVEVSFFPSLKFGRKWSPDASWHALHAFLETVKHIRHETAAVNTLARTRTVLRGQPK